MKRLLGWFLPTVALLGIGLGYRAEARVTAPFPSISLGQDDIWCAGPVGVESCLDYQANFLPTTTAAQSLGSTADQWLNLYLVNSPTLQNPLTIANGGTSTTTFLSGGVVIANPSFMVNYSTFVLTSAGLFGLGTGAPLYTFHNTGNEFTQGQVIVGSTLTVQGNAFSVGGSTLVVTGGKTGFSTLSPLYTTDISGNQRITGQQIVQGTVTVQGNAFSVGSSTIVVSNGQVSIGIGSANSTLEVSTNGVTSIFDMTGWTNYTPTFTGFSNSGPTGYVSRYKLIGKTCIFQYAGQPAGGTSNATTFTMSLPFTAARSFNDEFIGFLSMAFDNSAYVAGGPIVLTNENPNNHIDLHTNPGTAGWTSSGTKDAAFTLIYEIQ